MCAAFEASDVQILKGTQLPRSLALPSDSESESEI